MLLHSTMMGQSVPLVKDIMSPASHAHWRHNSQMAATPTNLQFQEAFRERLRTLRGVRTQAEMATALGIEHEAYKKYETRSMLPHHLLPKFAAVVGVDVAYLLTGVGGRRAQRATEAEDIDAMRVFAGPVVKRIGTRPASTAKQAAKKA